MPQRTVQPTYYRSRGRHTKRSFGAGRGVGDRGDRKINSQRRGYGNPAYYIAIDGYRERRLADEPVPPMGRGFLDGVNASLMQCGLDSSLDTCTYVTPVHAQAPDIEAAIRLVETVGGIYGFGIDPAPLEAFAAEVEQYYAGLAERVEERELSTDDRMYM
jgi:uncharacterized protein